MLFGVEGLQVTDAESGAGGTLEIWAVTDHAAASACPDCGTVSGRVHEQVLTRPRDVARGLDAVQVWWVKRRWKCQDERCERKTFTEWVPQVPPRCRLTGRLRKLAAEEIVKRGITPAEAARGNGMSWPVAHDAFAARAGPLLEQPPAAVAHLGIDEHRRGRPRWKLDEDTGEYILLADRWHTCSFDLSGQQGLLGQVEGRTAMTPRTGWRRPPPPGGTRSGRSRSTCALSMPLRSAGCCPARGSPWTCSTSCTWP